MRSVHLLLVLALLAPAAQALVSTGGPIVDFVWSEVKPRAPVTFTSTSHSPSSVIILHEWTFEGAEPGLLPTTGAEVEHVFPKPGFYQVTLAATDALLARSSVTRLVSVPHTPPTAVIGAPTSPIFRGADAAFVDLSFDEDGDAIVNSSWLISDTMRYGRNVTHVFRDLGDHPVELTVVDANGQVASARVTVHVANRPPVVSGDHAPRHPVAGETVTFQAFGHDPDGGSVTSFEWSFSDGVTLTGSTVTRTFGQAGEHTVSLRGEDADGGVSEPWVATIGVRQ